MSTIDQAGAASLRSEAHQYDSDRARAERVAAKRRRRTQMHNLAIRVVSLALALALWQAAGASVDPVLFTTPTKVAVAAFDMILSGELWEYLLPSLIVLMIGLTLAIVFGTMIGQIGRASCRERV